jgi:hypothetical protein
MRQDPDDAFCGSVPEPVTEYQPLALQAGLLLAAIATS